MTFPPSLGSRVSRWSLLTLLAATAFPASAHAQGAVVTGTVTADPGAQPLSQARVSVLGMNASALTNAQGKYTLPVTSVGSIVVRVQRVGYAEARKTATVVAGGTATVDFVVTPAIVQLADVVTTATGLQRRVELGNTVATLGDVNKRVEQTAVSSIGDLLVAKAAGMTVLPGNNTGSPPVIRIRGLNSLSLGNAPIFVIDGVRMNSGAIGTGSTSAATSNLTNLDPHEIEDIEIVKGPSAATLYGTDAANGVIVITTKRGHAGKTQWTWNAEVGQVTDPTQYLTAYALLGHTATAASARCLLIQVAAKTCFVDSSMSLNVLNTDSLTPLARGNRNQAGLQISGGNEAVRFFVSGDLENEIGPYKMPGFSVRRLDSLGVAVRDEWMRPEALQKENFRVNLTAAVTPTFDLTATAGFAKSDERVPGANNGFFSVQYQAMTGPGFTGPGPGYTAKGQLGEALYGYNGYVPSEMNQMLGQSAVQRFIGSFNTSWRPLAWLQSDGILGLDLADRSDLALCRYNECPVQGTLRQGRSSVTLNNDRNFSVKMINTGSWQARPWANLKTTVGGDYTNIEVDASTATGNILPPGGQRPQDGAIPSVSGTLATASKTLGLYVQEQASLRDRLFLTAAVRSDQNSAFGTNFQRVAYPKLSMSWVVSDESFFPHWQSINQFRIRTAYGASGVQPGSTQSLVTYTATSVSVPTANLGGVSGTDTPALRASSLGNPNLKPETSAEFEGGVDVRMFSNRSNLELTYFSKQTRDALISQPIAPSAGPSSITVLRNLGSIKNAGIEAVLNTTILDRRMLGWDITLSGSHITNKVVSLGFDANGVPNKTVGTGSTRDSVSTSVNGWFYRPYTFNDDNGDGLLVPSEVHVAANFAYYGYSLPRDILSIQNGFDLFNRKLRINALFDYKGGYSLLNNTANIQCAQSNSCPGASRLDATLAQQAANIANRNSNPSSAVGFLESGQYWRFRELSGTLALPARVAAGLRARDVALTVAGRNLHLWTKYTGPDPESNWGTGDVQQTYATSGQRRYVTARVTLHY
jgi:TonB-linked SusC/RagA family outer membrane protein